MTPKRFEEITASYFRGMGYYVITTPASHDYGADVFAENEKERFAIQCKMYGGSARKVNRAAIMQLHGVKDYFDCTGAVLATDGVLMPDATLVAEKLGISIVNPLNEVIISKSEEAGLSFFDNVWKSYIMPLTGKTISRDNGQINQILKVDWSGIERISSKGKKGFIGIEIFKLTVDRLEKAGYITRDEINQQYDKRASSGIVLILSQIPFFQTTTRPSGLIYVK